MGGWQAAADGCAAAHDAEEFFSLLRAFLGGGAALFRLLPQRARVNDINQELIGLYEVIRDDLTGLLDALRGFTNDPECYYAVRAWDRDRDRMRRYPRRSGPPAFFI